MSTHVNVLAVMDLHIAAMAAGRGRVSCTDLSFYDESRAQFQGARAAVSELIEAAKLLIAESVHPYDGGEYEDGEWIALDRARAALALVKGGAA